MNLLAILYFFQWVLSMFSSFIFFVQNCSFLCFQSNNRQIKILLITNVLCLKFDENKIFSQIKSGPNRDISNVFFGRVLGVLLFDKMFSQGVSNNA